MHSHSCFCAMKRFWLLDSWCLKQKWLKRVETAIGSHAHFTPTLSRLSHTVKFSHGGAGQSIDDLSLQAGKEKHHMPHLPGAAHAAAQVTLTLRPTSGHEATGWSASSGFGFCSHRRPPTRFFSSFLCYLSKNALHQALLIVLFWLF